MLHSSRRWAPLVVAVTTLAGVVVPTTTFARAAEARVVVAGSSALPAHASVVAASVTTNFDVALALRDPVGLQRFLSAVTTPSSPLYRHFLTPSTFAQRFGATPATIAAVRDYLTSFGVRVRLVTSSHTLMELRGRTPDIARAFATPVETVRLANGQERAQFARVATLPASIARDVTAVAGLSSVLSPQSHLVASHAAHAVALPTTCAAAAPSTTNAPNASGAYSVQQQAQLYGLSSAWAQGKTGVGQTIAVYELGAYDPTDTTNYFACYGIKPTLTTIAVDGGPTGGFSNEATMDIEEAAALAPGAALSIYAAPNTSSAPVDLYARIASDNTASIVSTSWGDCEIDPTGAVAAEKVIFEQMAAQGQTVIAASGDNGSSDCTGVVSNAPAVDDPASQPFVTGVGGLSVTSTNPLTQAVWNDGNGHGGGGGVSQVWSRPSWQSAPGIAATQTMRTVPDLSVMGDPATGFMFNFTGGTNASQQSWSSIGGTSIGAPLVSALVAVAANVCNTNRLGFLNPTFYRLARAGQGFVDVTVGNNDTFGTGVYAAGVGYDLASGLGSPNASLVNQLCPTTANAARSYLVSSTPKAYVSQPVHLALALRDPSGAPLVNTTVTVLAHASTGQVLVDADSASTQGPGNAQYDVVTDAQGNAAFTVSNSVAGPLVVTLKVNGVQIAATTVMVRVIPLSQQVPLTPVITSAVARSQSIVVTVRAHRANTPFVVALQVSVDGGRTWHSYPARDTRLVIGHLKGRTAYVVHLRAKNGVGTSPSARSARLITLR